MDSPEKTTVASFWAACIIEELVRAGVRRFCISPGYRSAELIQAISNRKELELITHYDERGAAFYALGKIRYDLKPTAVVCTSGTALANYYPAVVEASKAALPLIVISADRPADLRELGARQTIDQSNFFGKFVSADIDLPEPYSGVSFSKLLTDLDCVISKALGGAPVHINCQFSEPLISNEILSVSQLHSGELDQWLASKDTFTDIKRISAEVNINEIKQIKDLISKSQRGLIVVGETTQAACDSITQLAKHLNWPVLADIAAPIRFYENTSDLNFVPGFDLILRKSDFIESLKADLILHFGGPPIAKFYSKVKPVNGDYIHISPFPFRQDEFKVVSKRIYCAIEEFAKNISLSSESELTPLFNEKKQKAQAYLTNRTNESSKIEEWSVVRAAFENALEKQAFFLASSLPIRQADWFAPEQSKYLKVSSNRGVNGIDGTIASACGYASDHVTTTCAILGDLAFLHDLNSLPLLRGLSKPFVAIVLNNNGGGIFSMLDQLKQIKDFEKFYGTPHGLHSFEHFVKAVGLNYSCPNSLRVFNQEYKRAITRPGASILEIKTDKSETTDLIKEIFEKVVA